jgi:hypothetical protein
VTLRQYADDRWVEDSTVLVVKRWGDGSEITLSTGATLYSSWPPEKVVDSLNPSPLSSMLTRDVQGPVSA